MSGPGSCSSIADMPRPGRTSNGRAARSRSVNARRRSCCTAGPPRSTAAITRRRVSCSRRPSRTAAAARRRSLCCIVSSGWRSHQRRRGATCGQRSRHPSIVLNRTERAAVATRASRGWLAGWSPASSLRPSWAAILWMVADTFDLGAARSPVPVVSEEPLPVPPACEMRLLRADTLFRQGRLREALRVLEPGDPDQQHQARYDQLRGTIQRQLIAEGRRTAGFSTVDEPTPARSSTASPSRK